MQPNQNVFARPDTLLGVCEALGQDFGFNPNILRIVFAVSLFWSPLVSFAVYGVLGAAVLLSRLIAPPPAAAAPVETPVAATPMGHNDTASVPAALAA